MLPTIRQRKKPKCFGPKPPSASYNCQDNCYGTFSPTIWEAGWVTGSTINDNGAFARATVFSFTATWEVPALPKNPTAEVYMFSQIQSENYILQPCLLMYPGPNPQWHIQSVMYNNDGPCAYGEVYPVGSGELITGKIQLYDGKWQVITTSEASNYKSTCSLTASEVGPILSNFGGIALECYGINSQAPANQLPGTSSMWFDMEIKILGKPYSIDWAPWLAWCITEDCFPWLNLGESTTMLDPQTALMKFNGSQQTKDIKHKLAKGK